MRFKSALNKDHLALVHGFTDTIQRWDGEANEGEGRWVNSYIIDIVSKTFSEVSDNVYQVEIELKRSDLGDLLSEGDDQATADKINDAGYRYKSSDFSVEDVVALREELQEISFGMVRGNSEQVASVPKGLLHTPHGETKLKANIKLEDTDTPDKAKFKVGKDSVEFTLIETLTQAINNVNSVVFSPNGDYLAFAGNDSDIFIIQTSNWTEISESPITDESSIIHSISFSPDGNYLALASEWSNVRVFDTSNWEQIDTTGIGSMVGDTARVVTFSPNGDHLAIGGDNDVYIVQTSDWAEINASPLDEANDIIRTVAFSPNNDYIAYGGNDDNVYIHQVSDWTLVETLTQASGIVYSVAFSPDGEYLAIGSADDNVYIFEIESLVILGSVELSGSGVEGAIVTAINQDTREVSGHTTTDSNGDYEIEVISQDDHHVIVEYEDENGKYHTFSYPFVTPVDEE